MQSHSYSRQQAAAGNHHQAQATHRPSPSQQPAQQLLQSFTPPPYSGAAMAAAAAAAAEAAANFNRWATRYGPGADPANLAPQLIPAHTLYSNGTPPPPSVCALCNAVFPSHEQLLLHVAATHPHPMSSQTPVPSFLQTQQSQQNYNQSHVNITQQDNQRLQQRQQQVQSRNQQNEHQQGNRNQQQRQQQYQQYQQRRERTTISLQSPRYPYFSPKTGFGQNTSRQSHHPSRPPARPSGRTPSSTPVGNSLLSKSRPQSDSRTHPSSSMIDSTSSQVQAPALGEQRGKGSSPDGVGSRSLPLTSTTAPAQSPLNLTCAICDIRCDTVEMLRKHRAGNKHRKRAEQAALFQTAAESFAANQIRPVNGGWFCVACDFTFSFQNEVLQHLDSVRHRNRLQPHAGSSRAADPTSGLASAAKRQRIEPPVTSATSSGSASTLTPTITSPSASVPPSAHASAPVDGSTSFLPSYPTPVCTGTPTISDSMPKPSETNGPEPGSGAPSASSSEVASGASVEKIAMTIDPAPLSPLHRPLSALAAAAVSTPQLTQENLLEDTTTPIIKTETVVKSDPSFHCAMCNVTCNTAESLAQHLNSQRHGRRKANQVADVTSLPDKNPVEILNSADIRCEICNAVVCGRDNYMAHLRGKKHKHRVKLQQQREEEQKLKKQKDQEQRYNTAEGTDAGGRETQKESEGDQASVKNIGPNSDKFSLIPQATVKDAATRTREETMSMEEPAADNTESAGTSNSQSTMTVNITQVDAGGNAAKTPGVASQEMHHGQPSKPSPCSTSISIPLQVFKPSPMLPVIATSEGTIGKPSRLAEVIPQVEISTEPVMAGAEDQLTASSNSTARAGAEAATKVSDVITGNVGAAERETSAGKSKNTLSTSREGEQAKKKRMDDVTPTKQNEQSSDDNTVMPKGDREKGMDDIERETSSALMKEQSFGVSSNNLGILAETAEQLGKITQSAGRLIAGVSKIPRPSLALAMPLSMPGFSAENEGVVSKSSSDKLQQLLHSSKQIMEVMGQGSYERRGREKESN